MSCFIPSPTLPVSLLYPSSFSQFSHLTFILLCHASNSTAASLLKCVDPLSTSLCPSLLLFFMHHLILHLPILPSIPSCLFIGICYSTWSYYHFKERQWAPALLLEIRGIVSQSGPGCFIYATGKDTLHWANFRGYVSISTYSHLSVFVWPPFPSKWWRWSWQHERVTDICGRALRLTVWPHPLSHLRHSLEQASCVVCSHI